MFRGRSAFPALAAVALAPRASLCADVTDECTLSNVELRAADSCCNPYIALAALARAGMLGMAAATRLPPAMNMVPGRKISFVVNMSLALFYSLLNLPWRAGLQRITRVQAT